MTIQKDWIRNRHDRKYVWEIVATEMKILERNEDRWIGGADGDPMRSGMS
jgi:hypothetical protein